MIRQPALLGLDASNGTGLFNELCDLQEAILAYCDGLHEEVGIVFESIVIL